VQRDQDDVGYLGRIRAVRFVGVAWRLGSSGHISFVGKLAIGNCSTVGSGCIGSVCSQAIGGLTVGTRWIIDIVCPSCGSHDGACCTPETETWTCPVCGKEYWINWGFSLVPLCMKTEREKSREFVEHSCGKI